MVVMNPLTNYQQISLIGFWLSCGVPLTSRTNQTSRAALLRSDGRVVDLDGSEVVAFKGRGLSDGAFYIVIRHRNHIPVMSDEPIAFDDHRVAYNFVNGPGYGGQGQHELDDDVFGLYAADGTGNGNVTEEDQFLVSSSANMIGYLQADYDMDGVVAEADQDLGSDNMGVQGGVPVASNTPTSTETDVDDPVPSTFTLEQNYPNPFNPMTTIAYALPVPADVRIDIFDALGREVAKVVSSWQPAGQYAVSFDAKELPSGMYFYRIQAGSFTRVRTMILIK